MAYRWTGATGGAVPIGAAEQGRDIGGQALFVARAAIDGGLHPGKIRAEFGAANIPYNGKEAKVNPYEVLMDPGVWVAAANGRVPVGAVVAGYEASGEPLFVARAALPGGGMHPGKVRLAFGAANIGFHDKEVKVYQYEVLVEHQ